MQDSAPALHAPFSVGFAGRPLSEFATLRVETPALGARASEEICPSADRLGQRGRFSLYRSGRWLLGAAQVAIGLNDLESQTSRLYGELFDAARGSHLCRIWNYVPAINARGADGTEQYHAFSSGRAVAFETEFGAAFKQCVPAASAVGTSDQFLTVIFAASPNAPRHVENPAQIPAYEYPREHGPRSPSFARATIVPAGTRQCDVFVAGTSAIKGHATISPGDTLAQLACTLDNLRGISLACGLGENLAAGRSSVRHVKIYLRHREDHAAVERELARDFLHPDDRATYLLADICRASLNVEIEITILGARA
jgi:hypothetical protein